MALAADENATGNTEHKSSALLPRANVNVNLVPMYLYLCQIVLCSS